MIFNSIIVDRTVLLRSMLAVVVVTVAFSWSTLQGRASNASESDYKMAQGSVVGSGGLSGAAAAGLGESNRQNAAKSQGSKDNRGGVGGGTSVTNPNKPTNKLPSIPDHVPDTDGGVTPPAPLDLSLISGSEQLPQRRPLHNAAVSVTQTGVTGYAGVFIPTLALIIGALVMAAGAA